MADTAAHLLDRVLREAPVRQWVLTLAHPLRYRCAYDAKLTAHILMELVGTGVRLFLSAIFTPIPGMGVEVDFAPGPIAARSLEVAAA